MWSPSIVGGTADFDKNSSPTEQICRGLLFSFDHMTHLTVVK